MDGFADASSAASGNVGGRGIEREIVDVHWHWYPCAFFEHLIGSGELPRCRRVGDQYQLEVSGGQFLPFPADETYLEAQIAMLNAQGIATVVASPGSISIDALGAARATELALLLNEEMARAERLHQERFIGVATLPLIDGDAALEALDHAVVTLGLRAVWLPSNVAGEPLVSHRTRPVFTRIAELGAVALLHPVRTVMVEKLSDYGLEFVAGYVFDTSLAALGLVLGGVMEELPDLKILHPHLGGVLPYLAGRIDREYRQPWLGTKVLSEPPSAYLRRFYTDSVSDNLAALRYALDFYPPGHLLFGSDHPWWPVPEGIEVVRNGLDADAAGAVLSQNARSLFAVRSAAPDAAL
jgi:predicted TIM-barrel fold metal-dependent hydrolase